ncbi:hypothetical protein V8F33_006815 [Rhypophila sp. PSN 637]
MKLSNILVLLVSGGCQHSGLAKDTVEFVDVPAPDPSTGITIQRRQNLVVQVCGGAVYANTHVTQPLNTFGSFNTRGGPSQEAPATASTASTPIQTRLLALWATSRPTMATFGSTTASRLGVGKTLHLGVEALKKTRDDFSVRNTLVGLKVWQTTSIGQVLGHDRVLPDS